MNNNLHQSLDDIISKNKNRNSNNRGDRPTYRRRGGNNSYDNRNNNNNRRFSNNDNKGFNGNRRQRNNIDKHRVRRVLKDRNTMEVDSGFGELRAPRYINRNRRPLRRNNIRHNFDREERNERNGRRINNGFQMKRNLRRDDRYQRRRPRFNNINESFVKTEGTHLRPASSKIFISNIPKTATNNELQKIFNKFGDLKKCGIHWDQLGNSRGTAEIEYFDRRAARAAIREVDNVPFRGEHMYVQYARRTAVKFRKGGLKLGRRRVNSINNNNSNNNNNNRNSKRRN